MLRFYYVYVLRSRRDRRHYIGSTHDLKERLKQHNAGLVASTKPRRPLDLIFYEAYLNERDAKRRERYLKTSKGKATLQVMLSSYFAAAQPEP